MWCAWEGNARVSPRVPRARSRFEVADQGKVPHRRHRAALGQGDAAVFRGPVDQALPRKLRAPAETAGQGRKRELGEFSQTLFSADVVDQDQLAAGPQDAHELVERAFGI